MRKIFKKIFKKLDNTGSSIVMVVVALAFIGIIVGALLSAASYAYNQKLQELNAKDNFYYVEQAMQEIYAGVGVHTIEEMKDAYIYTVENMIYYNTESGSYIGQYESIGDEAANELFKNTFMLYMQNSDYFNKGPVELAKILQNYISNDTVRLDPSKLTIEYDRTFLEDGSSVLNAIIIKDVTLTREQEYKKSSGKGTYTQTISADIVISKPNFEVSFSSINNDYPNIFDYAMIADMGVEISDVSAPISISGDLYAGADYYNKDYNNAGNDDTALQVPAEGTTQLKVVKNTTTGAVTVSQGDIKYAFAKVTNKDPYATTDTDDANDATGYVFPVVENEPLVLYDGINERSAYSGIYINNSDVTIVGSKIIVPGTLAVMNRGKLTVLSATSSTKSAEIWADSVAIGGTSLVSDATGVGASAFINADLYVRDDTEINADYATFELNGAYYGYSNSTTRDTRVFVPTVNPSYFTYKYYVTDANGSIIKDGEGNPVTATQNRGHYNSSSIVINGQHSSINLEDTTKLYLAGRAYIELSKKVSTTVSDEGVISQTYIYDPSGEDTVFLRDYKTAESVTLKPNQLMYDVSGLGQVYYTEIDETNFKMVQSASDRAPYSAILLEQSDNTDVRDFFYEYFPKTIFNDFVPCTRTQVGNRVVYFIDFQSAYDHMKDVVSSTQDVLYLNAVGNSKAGNIDDEGNVTMIDYDAYTAQFIMDYFSATRTGSDTLKATLNNVTDYSDFQAGDITLAGSDIYSSGVLTVKEGSTVEMKVQNDSSVIQTLFGGAWESDPDVNNPTEITALDMSNDLVNEFVSLKWNLVGYDKVSNDERAYLKNVISTFGESAITPINRYLIADNINKKLDTYIAGGRVIISNENVTISDSDTVGIVIAKGDVTFTEDAKSFQGIIISGGKIFVGKNMTAISSGDLMCKAIIDTCLTNMDNPDCLYVLSVFEKYKKVVEEYSNPATDSTDDSEDPTATSEEDEFETFTDGGNSMTVTKTIETIDYTDVVSFQNWMKNVGGDYVAP